MRGAKGERFRVAKGAPQVIMGLVANAAEVGSEVDQAFAGRGFRSLGVARGAEGEGWVIAFFRHYVK